MYHFVTTYFHLIYFHLLLPAKGERRKSRADGTATLSEPRKRKEVEKQRELHIIQLVNKVCPHPGLTADDIYFISVRYVGMITSRKYWPFHLGCALIGLFSLYLYGACRIDIFGFYSTFH